MTAQNWCGPRWKVRSRASPSSTESQPIATARRATATPSKRLTVLLHADVRAYQDGGGAAKAARRVLVGPRNISRFAAGVTSLHHARRAVTLATVNGAPGAIITLSGAVHVLSIEVHEGRIHRLFDVCNPRKHATAGRSERPTVVDAS